MSDIAEFYKKIPSTKKEYCRKIAEDFGISDTSKCRGAILFGAEKLGRKMLLVFVRKG